MEWQGGDIERDPEIWEDRMDRTVNRSFTELMCDILSGDRRAHIVHGSLDVCASIEYVPDFVYWAEFTKANCG